MAETQLSFFDAPASRSHQRTQKDKELETLLVQHLGVNGAKKWHQKVAKQQAKLDAFLNQPRTPEQEATRAADRESIFAKIRASTKPLVNEYALLGVQPGATKRDIKNAYRRQARKLHPDKGGDAQAFQQMHDAYRRLLASVKE